jgi:nitrate reductase gamma subunit
MNALYSLLMVMALVLVGAVGIEFSAGRNFLMLGLPYIAFAAFLVAFCWRILQWAVAPVPFRIPVTCGQQESLPWIKTAHIDNPSTGWGASVRMASEVLLFRSLFRNSSARVRGGRLIFGESKYPWLAALAFHWALLFILLRHVRLVVEHVPAFVNGLERLDAFFQFATPQIYLSDVVLLAALSYLLARRFSDPQVRYISLFTDYFALLLIIGIAISGVLMRYFVRADVLSVKQFVLSVAAFRPVAPQAPGAVFLVHLLLVCTLAAYFPFSKLMHAGGVFLSPTRNLANNSRRKRHINPWDYQVKTHTYAEWEEEFHDKIQAAGIPLEGDDV